VIGFVEDANLVAWDCTRYTSWQSREDCFEIGQVAQVGTDGPAGFSLPPCVVDEHVRQVAVQPKDGVGVASLSYKTHSAHS